LPLDEVPDGVDEHATWCGIIFGAVRNYAFVPKPHDDLGGALGFHGFRDRCKVVGRALCGAEKKAWRGLSARSPIPCSTCTPNEHGYTEINPAALGARRSHVRDGPIAEICRGQFKTFFDVTELDVEAS